MTLLSNTSLTLYDVAKRTNPDGSAQVLAELLTQENEMLDDIPFVESNQITGHTDGIRTGLPDVYFRSLNQGIPSSKSTSAQIVEGCGLMEGHSVVDEEVLALNGNSAAYRLSEDSSFVESMNQKFQRTMFLGNASLSPEEWTGLGIRYSSLSAGNAQNVLSAGGSGSDNASVYLVGWGLNKVFGIYPKGSMAGLQMTDLGKQIQTDSTGRRFVAMMSQLKWKAGLFVKDWRYVVRIANIDVSDWIGKTGTQANTGVATHLLNLMSRATDRVPSMSGANFAFYANRSVFSGLKLQAQTISQNVLAVEDSMTQFGKTRKDVKFLGIPVRNVDQLGIAETIVT